MNVITKEDALNALIKDCNANLISDGYHTFGELYEHRIVLYIALCREIAKRENPPTVFRTKTHADGSSWDGWFVLGISTVNGEQITYHLPESKWDECDFALTFDQAISFDGHTSQDVLQRLSQL